jgi:glycosyltransferase involved in cell wall biosynthesis
MSERNLTCEGLVTVCIPVFNCEEFIASAIQSVLSQSYTNIELIILDNKSEDRTLEIVLNFTDPRIVVIRNPENIGMARNWSRCIHVGRGEYLKILPADDVIEKDCIERQVAVFKHPGPVIGLVASARKVINEKGRVIIKYNGFARKSGYIDPKVAIKKIVQSGGNPLGEPGAILMKSSAARMIGDFSLDQPYTIDIDYWCRLLDMGGMFYISSPLSSFRISPGSESVSLIKKQNTEVVWFIKQLHSKYQFVTFLDLCCGVLASRLKSIVRLILYRMVLN